MRNEHVERGARVARMDCRERVALFLFSGVILGLSACAGIGSTGSGTAVSTATSIPEDVKVCGFLTPSETENALGHAVEGMNYHHSPGYTYEGEADPAMARLACTIFPLSKNDPQVSMWYEPMGVIDEVAYMRAGRPTVFDDAKDFENAEGFTIDGVEGEGLTLIDERKSVAMWHYPDDHVLMVKITFYNSEDIVDQTKQARALVEASVNGVVEQASKPRQEFTGYPSDSAAPGVEYATPNPESG